MKTTFTLFQAMLLVFISAQNIFAQTETEPNNWAINASQTTIGSLATGHLGDVGDNKDWWKLDVTGTGLLDVLVTANPNDWSSFTIELYHYHDTTFRVIYHNAPNLPLILPAEPGTYYILITVSGNGNYSLNSSCAPPFYTADANEPDNGFASGAVAVPSNPWTGAIRHYYGMDAYNAGHDRWDNNDWWTLNTNPGNISFFIEKNDVPSFYVEVYDSSNTTSGAWLAYGIISSIDTVTLFVTAGSGNYKIRLWSTASVTSNGSYRITHSGTTGIDDALHEEKFVLYPSPSNGIFMWNSLTKFSEIKIYNLLGENIYNEKINSSKPTIDLSKKSKGVYFYRLINDKQILKTGKIIIE